ncbi:SGNH/GDSL hydrolase family protein [Corticibacter populi]|uniref:SGNH/GDSL hydrolase family protein n=1 Tax=Corticibacter populi TaxID=1550736 RepID=A0A3M6QUJ4_9BURK|nr:SGNH/GDSL hydrolase family protein [Corticibacter populi]RMX06705.1 SGNH/GDSL hydrolase family protein [Corticibacter populi]RZS31714.1 lysophospholipase L1-like esterase [Corticibacter populi]
MTDITNQATVEAVNKLIAQLQQAVNDGLLTLQAAASARVFYTREEMDAVAPEAEQWAVLIAGSDMGYYNEQGGAWVWSDLQPATASQLAGIATKVQSKVEFFPFGHVGRQVPVWFENGDLAARGMAPALRRIAVQDVAGRLDVSPAMVPLGRFGRDVWAWLEPGGVNFSGVSAGLVAQIAAQLPQPEPTVIPIASDGRSLWRLRAKQGLLRAGVPSTRLRVGFTGDSWTELYHIPGAMRMLLGEVYGIAGDGFLNVNAGNSIADSVVSWSAGWTLVDGSTTTNFPYGAAQDGHCRYTADTTATINITNCRATDVQIMYFNFGGTFSYRVDGGAWVDVVCTDDGSFGHVDISGLADVAHTININTASNSGVVSIVGFNVTRAEASGVEVHRMGNGGLRGPNLLGFAQYIEQPAALLDLDALVVFLGTNDYRASSSTPEVYAEALAALIDAYRAASPDIGIILCAPMDTNGVAVHPLSAYRDAAYQVARDKSTEFLDLYDMWPSWTAGNALGLWRDNLHVNEPGAAIVCKTLNDQFFKAGA